VIWCFPHGYRGLKAAAQVCSAADVAWRQ
jgi:hypothetical protein